VRPARDGTVGRCVRKGARDSPAAASYLTVTRAPTTTLKGVPVMITHRWRWIAATLTAAAAGAALVGAAAPVLAAPKPPAPSPPTPIRVFPGHTVEPFGQADTNSRFYPGDPSFGNNFHFVITPPST
jgi:hypothetical protein